MVEKVVIEVVGDAKIDTTVKQLEKVGAVDEKNAKQFEANNKKYQQGVKDSTKTINSHVESLKSLVPAVTAAFAVQQVIAFGKASLNAAIEAERGNKLLFNALNQNKAAFDRLTKAATTYQKTTIYDDDSIIAAQTFLATQGRTEEQINKVIRAATNLSAVTGESLQTSVEKLDATYEGSIGRLGKMDSRFKTLTQAQLENGAAIDLVAEKYKGFAEAELETTAGQIKKLQNQFGELQEALGQSILMGAAPIFKDIASEISATNNEIGKLADTFGLAGDSAEDFNTITFLTKNIISALSEPFRALNWIIEKNAQGFNWLAEKLGLASEKTKTIADLVAENQKVIDAQNASKEKDVEVTEKQVKTLETLAATVKRLTDERAKIQVETQAWTDKDKELTEAQKELDKYIKKSTAAIKEQKKELDKPVQLEDALGGTLDVTDYEAKQKEIADAAAKSNADVAENDEYWRQENRKRIKEETEFELSEEEKLKNEKIRIAEEEAQRREEIIAELGNAINQLMRIGFQQIQNQEQQQTDFFLQNLEIKKAAGEISEEQYAKLRKSFLQQQAQDQHDLAVFTATVNGALAVINAITTGDPYTAAVRAAIAGAIAAAEIAVIASQPVPQFEKGGKVKGKSHKEGGVHAELEGDEFVISKKAARRIGFDNLELLNKGIVPIKMLRQSLSDQKAKGLETSMMKIFGSTDFDTYPIEKLLKKSMQNDRQIGQQLVRELRGSTRKRGGLR